MQHYTYSFILYLIITLLTESIVVFLLLRKFLKVEKQQLSNKEILSATIFASSLTMPYVWFIFPYLISNFIIAIWISEIFVVIIEMTFYKIFIRLSWKNALLISFLANLMSFGLGKFLHYLFGNS